MCSANTSVHSVSGVARLALVACAAGFAGVAGGATIVPTAQQRSVHSMVIVPPCAPPSTVIDNDSATDFGPFSGKVEASRICDFAHGIAGALQQSHINPASMSADGSASSNVFSVNNTVIHAIPTSFFDVTFQVLAPARYFINGDLSASGGLPVVVSYARLTLSNAANQTLLNLQVNPGPGGALNTLNVHETGMLAPGQYRLVVQATSAVDYPVPPAGTGVAAYDMLAEFQRPGDADLNGVVEVDDLVAVILSWGPCATPCPADFNQNGFVDADDLIAVILNWGT